MAGEATREGMFPVSRVMAFCDAVFAFAMTLLAVELRLPTAELVRTHGEAAAWAQQMPLYIAFVFSFLVTALFWMSHLETWKHVRRVGPGLLWLCILQMMFVVLMPFATNAFSSSFVSPSRTAFVLYCCVLTAISLLLWLQRRCVARDEAGQHGLSEADAHWFQLSALVPLLVFAASIPLALVLPSWAGSLLFASIWPLTMLARRRHVRRFAQA